MGIPEKLERAISIRQPHAEEILRRRKRNEYRSWLTHVRGRVYLYACLRADDNNIKALPRGMIVGSVEIVGCNTDEDGGFAWNLARPRRYRKAVKPLGTPQPGFWRPTFD